MNSSREDELKQVWPDGSLLDIGRAIYESIPMLCRPVWAAAILDLCRSCYDSIPAVDSLYDIADNADRWHEAHAAFCAIRRLTLAYERDNSFPPTYGALLFVAELVDKVTYNASGCEAPFDDDSGWYLTDSVRYFSRTLRDPAFDPVARCFLLVNSFPTAR